MGRLNRRMRLHQHPYSLITLTLSWYIINQKWIFVYQKKILARFLAETKNWKKLKQLWSFRRLKYRSRIQIEDQPSSNTKMASADGEREDTPIRFSNIIHITLYIFSKKKREWLWSRISRLLWYIVSFFIRTLVHYFFSKWINEFEFHQPLDMNYQQHKQWNLIGGIGRRLNVQDLTLTSWR